jgi:hypothetical protein
MWNEQRLSKAKDAFGLVHVQAAYMYYTHPSVHWGGSEFKPSKEPVTCLWCVAYRFL